MVLGVGVHKDVTMWPYGKVPLSVYVHMNFYIVKVELEIIGSENVETEHTNGYSWGYQQLILTSEHR